MKKYFELLKSVKLFSGIDPADFDALLGCISPEVKSLAKDEILLLTGDRPQFVGIMLAGQLHIVREDCDGNRSMIAAVTPCEIFAEALCCAGVTESPVTVIAGTESTVMLFDFPRVLRTCARSCPFHSKLLENMLEIISRKNLRLQSRMEFVGLKSVRSKVLRYLESFSPVRGKNITVPFNREGMADFLCVERSALSHELAKMKNDGLIEYRKNTFVLK